LSGNSFTPLFASQLAEYKRKISHHKTYVKNNALHQRILSATANNVAYPDSKLFSFFLPRIVNSTPRKKRRIGYKKYDRYFDLKIQ